MTIERKLTDTQVEEVADHLRGTCKDLAGALPEGIDEDDLAIADHNALDDKVFCCKRCGWWSDVSELADTESGALVCEECHEGGYEC